MRLRSAPFWARVRATRGRQAGAHSFSWQAALSTLPGTEQVLTEQRDWGRNVLRPSRELIVRDNSPSYTAAAIRLSLCAILKWSSLLAAAWGAQNTWDNTLKQFSQSLAHGIGRCLMMMMMVMMTRRSVISSAWILSKRSNLFKKYNVSTFLHRLSS